jgi:resuscitation-promoting factor RpfB
MKINRRLALAFALFLFACQPATPPTVTIIDNDNVTTLQTEERVPAAIFAQAGITVDALDRVLFNGVTVQPDQALPKADSVTLQIRRHVEVILSAPQGQIKLVTSAFTIGEALAEKPYQLHAEDKVDPPLDSPIENGMTITITTSHTLTISADWKSVTIQSSARTVGEALAEAGIPLLGLDQAVPSENEALPSDGNIKVVRVSEAVTLIQKPIPFESESVASADVPLDQTQILSPGENGLTVQRVRVRYEDGQEVSRVTESETMVRAPKTRKLAYGTKVEITTATVDGVQIQYWRAVQMYATSYSPCNIGTSTCGSTTASGKQLQKGMVALRTDLYFALKGQPLYIPGYGFATVEDACGGCVGKPWIDLGFTDADYVPWHSTVTVYFLAPAPSNIPIIE